MFSVEWTLYPFIFFSIFYFLFIYLFIYFLFLFFFGLNLPFRRFDSHASANALVKRALKLDSRRFFYLLSAETYMRVWVMLVIKIL